MLAPSSLPRALTPSRAHSLACSLPRSPLPSPPPLTPPLTLRPSTHFKPPFLPLRLHFHDPRSDTAVLHVGDFRAAPCLRGDPTLLRLLRERPVDTLYLDTTYCRPHYTFPEQEAACASMAEITRRELGRAPRTLFLCSSYSIGKENAVEAVARAAGVPALVTAHRARMLRWCDRWDDALYTEHDDDGGCTGGGTAGGGASGGTVSDAGGGVRERGRGGGCSSGDGIGSMDGEGTGTPVDKSTDRGKSTGGGTSAGSGKRKALPPQAAVHVVPFSKNGAEEHEDLAAILKKHGGR